MSGADAFPPPGGWQPPPAGWQPYPYAAAPVHRPGAIPLRPLGLGDLYDGAFKIIRHNPRATVGSAALVSAVAMFVPVGFTVLLASLFDLSSSDAFGAPMTEAEVLVELAGGVAIAVGAVLQFFGLLLVTGMVALVTEAAATGRTMGLGEAWALTRGRRWRLVGLALINTAAVAVLAVVMVVLVVALVALHADVLTIVVLVLLAIPTLVAAGVWLWIRLFYLPVPAMMIERTGVFRAIGRAFRLTSHQFWRTFGIALLTGILIGFAGQFLSLPVSLPGALAPEFIEGNRGAYIYLLTQALGAVLSSAFVTPFAAAVSSLQYVDQRMRKEAYDVQLLGQAGISAP